MTIISNLPHCNVLIDGEPEEVGTNDQGKLSIPMEPGIYDVSLTNPGYVTEGREIEVRAVPPYRQEEVFVLRRVLLSLHVKTNPPGVKVILDGTREGESDADGLLTFKDVDPSVQHTLRGVKEDYRDAEVVVPPYKNEASVRLARDVFTLKVKTYPPQAEVFLDNEPKGTSDADGVLLIPKVKADEEHTLRSSKEGYVTQSTTVPANYELAVIKLPSVEAAPSSSAGQTKAVGQAEKAVQEGRPGTADAGGSANPTADTSQGAAAPAGSAASRDGEERPPSPQKNVQSGTPVSPLDVELAFWNTIKDSKNPEEFAAYLRKYPEGQFAEIARIRMNALLSGMKGEPDSPAAQPSPESAKPSPTPTPTPAPTPTSTSNVTPTQAPTFMPPLTVKAEIFLQLAKRAETPGRHVVSHPAPYTSDCSHSLTCPVLKPVSRIKSSPRPIAFTRRLSPFLRRLCVEEGG